LILSILCQAGLLTILANIIADIDTDTFCWKYRRYWYRYFRKKYRRDFYRYRYFHAPSSAANYRIVSIISGIRRSSSHCRWSQWGDLLSAVWWRRPRQAILSLQTTEREVSEMWYRNIKPNKYRRYFYRYFFEKYQGYHHQYWKRSGDNK